MPTFSLFDNQRKSLDYQYMDKTLSDWYRISGPSIFVHKYLGVYAANVDEDGNPITDPTSTATSTAVSQIQDLVLMENRDRMYDPVVREIHGVFQINDVEMSLSQFGIYNNSDTLFIEFHINDMLAIIGRKIIAGDVIELPNFRDDALLGEDGAANKYYVVTEGKRAPSSYQATWMPHSWRVKCDPMTSSQEYADILSAPTQNPFGIDTTSTLASLISTAATDLGINEAIVQQAEDKFLRRNFETRHLWIVPGDNYQSAWVFAGDGVPPNGAVLSGSGANWPETSHQGDYFLRTDYRPNTLFRYEGNGWHAQEMNYRQIWTAAGRLMMEQINNRDTVTFNDGTTQASRQNLYQVVKPTADYGADTPLASDAQDFPTIPGP